MSAERGAEQAALDVDARFLLANERTLLAWVRTALALLAAGVATSQLAGVGAGTALSLGLLASGCAVAVTGGVRWAAADRALRAGRLPARGRAPYLLVGLVVGLGLGAGGALLLT